MNKAVSDYMREMQRRSAQSRWSGLSAAEKSAAMKAIRAKGKRKPKARGLRQNKTSGDTNAIAPIQPRLNIPTN